jgi:hypothetical protein
MRTLTTWTLAIMPLVAFPAGVHAQAGNLEAGLHVRSLRAEPAELRLVAGQTVPFRVVALDENGNPVDAALRVSAPRSGDGALRIGDGTVTGLNAGAAEIIVTVILPPNATVQPTLLRVPVTIAWPPIDRVDVTFGSAMLYAGTTLRHRATAYHADASTRPRPDVQWSSSDSAIASVDRFGNVTAHRAGEVSITARADGRDGVIRHTVAPFTGTAVAVETSASRVRVGDVVTLGARVTAANGSVVANVPVQFTYTFTPDDSIASPGAPGLIAGDHFVAEVPGRYTILAHAGSLTSRQVIEARPRQAIRTISTVGHGAVTHVHTSDLWVYEGMNGRDHAITGTWGADGWAYFWDVNDPARIVKTDSLHIDARTVNDVKVAPNGRYAALSREGASNRRNGVVILDLADPAHPTIAAVHDDGLTGGVHNMFATDDYLFALSGGDKYVILDVRDLKNPKLVSEYNHPDSRIHDVWVYNGIAYSSEWHNGVVVVDVGNGRWGGTIENPKFVASIPYPVGQTHAAFPYYQQTTGKTYLFLGDEIIGRGEGAAWRGMPNSGDKGGTPEVTSGYYHIIDATDPMNPRDVARYEVSEFGTHNLWIEDDILFAAYYEGGVRMVDVSGELLGNLAEQDREIAVFKPHDPNGFVPNGVMVWGAQPHKGHIFLADHYNGLWALKMSER